MSPSPYLAPSIAGRLSSVEAVALLALLRRLPVYAWPATARAFVAHARGSGRAPWEVTP